MQRVKVVVESFAYGASVTSLEGVGKPCENTRERGQVRTRGWQTATKRKGRMANDRSQKRQQSEKPCISSFPGQMEYGTVRALLRRALQRDTSQHGILGVDAPFLASAACKVAPHVALVLVASPGLQDLVLIDGAQFPKSDGSKLRLSDGEVLQKLA